MFKNYDPGPKRDFSELLSPMLVGTVLAYGLGYWLKNSAYQLKKRRVGAA